ncbi:MAG: trimethylamine methyltransferase family protein [Kiritimatiellae bacterium]|nr:trimethylamine methyltransferase family protein [Kiritimatiellia bacterium]
MLTRFDRILERATLDAMHQAALDMLAGTGLRVDHPDILAELERHAGFNLDASPRVKVSAERVEAWVSEHRTRHKSGPRAPHTAAEPARPCFSVSDRPMWMVERDGKTLRQTTREDVIAGVKLTEALRDKGVRPGATAVPTDVPLRIQPLEQFLITAEYCRDGGRTSQVTDLAAAEIIREMDRVYGRPPRFSIWCPSPLIFGGPELDIFWHFRDEAASVSVGSMPMMGMTAPCDPVGVATLAMAETIGGAAIVHALFPDLPVTIHPHPEPVDMRTGTIVFGTPEWDLLDLMHRDIFRYYGRERGGKLLHTTASVPGAQAQIERTTSATLGVLGGYTAFGPAGQLGLDDVWSPAQLILDLDIVAHAARIARGPEHAPGLETGALAGVVHDVVQSGFLFAEHETTLANMRSQYHQPVVLQRLGRPQWMGAGCPELVADANRYAEERIETYEYEPPRDTLRELRAIYERGRERLGTL